MLKDEKAISSIKKIVSPVVKAGYEVLEFESESNTESITKSEATTIVNFESLDKPIIDDAQVITAWVTPYAPVYDKDKTKWKFRLGEAIVSMDISETHIVENTMQRGASLMSDAYHVKLELRQEYKSSNRISTEYKIIEVLDFRPGTIAQQENLFRDEPNES